MKKFLLLLTLVVASIGIARADSYTISFSSTATNPTALSSSVQATTFIANASQGYVAAKPISDDASNSYYGGQKETEKKSIRIGKAKAAGNVTFKLSETAQVKPTSIVVSVAKYQDSDNDATLTVNGKTADVTSTTFEDKTFTFTGADAIQTIALSTNAPSGKSSNRIYIQSITVNYDASGSEDPDQPQILGDLTATYGSEAIASNDVVTFDQGTSISFHADNATSFVINETETLEAVDGTATWTPAVCENTAISVVAKREIEGEETQTSEALTFTLTVNKLDFIVADWVVIGIKETQGGSPIHDNLQCKEGSAKGVWRADHNTAYTATNEGAAQLGSGTLANTFNGGTLTLSGSDIPENAIIRSVSLTGYNKSTNNAIWDISVGDNTVSDAITFTNSSATHTAENLNLVGNAIVLTCKAPAENANIKQLYLSGISVKYTVPEEEVQLGEITASYNAGFSMAEDTESELYVMAGTKITFSSENAAIMEIVNIEDAENPVVLQTENAASVIFTVSEDYHALQVNAYTEGKTKSVTHGYEIVSEEVTPVKPEIARHDTDAKEVTFSTGAGALMIMIAPEQPAANGAMRIEAQDWAFTPDPKSHTINYSNLVDEVMLVSVKSVTPKAESEPYVMRLSSDGDVSGIEGVEAGASNGKAVYYNLQGQLVDATRPGLYIRCQGGRAEKVLVR